MSRIALLVGIDDYQGAPLAGCVNDANSLSELLRRNYDDSPNFECRPIVSSKEDVTRPKLRSAIEDLFRREADVALFFFAGHGTVNNLGGFLVTQDAAHYDEGVGMVEVLELANRSPARERVIIVDCCHSGVLGNLPAIANDVAVLKEGVSVLCAARSSEASLEMNGGGLFTSLVCSALEGGGADVCGKVTVASIYAYADEALGGFQQRPLLKSHVSKLVSLRTCAPSVGPAILRLLPKYFPSPGAEHALDPSFEPDAEPSHPENERVFGHLQKLRAARLVEPVGEEHMYFAAMNSGRCRLTALGRFYWHVANDGRL